MARLETRRVAGRTVYFLDGRVVPPHAELELWIDERWICGRFGYATVESGRPSFTLQLEHMSPDGEVDASVVTIRVAPTEVFRWPA